jgi:membrane protein required for colicin V production
MSAFTALDVIVLLLVGGAAVLGFLRGFTTEVLSLIAWIVAVFAVKLFHEPVTLLVRGWVGTEGGAMVLALALVFGITFFAGRMTARALGRRTRQSVLGSFDRVLGIGFGALKGLIIAAVIYLAVNLVYDTIYGGRAQRPEWMAKSYTYPLLDASSRALVDFVQQRQADGDEPANASKNSTAQ